MQAQQAAYNRQGRRQTACLGRSARQRSYQRGRLGRPAVRHRVKTDVSQVGTLDNNLPVYAYRYLWGGPMRIGVMAQDVERSNRAVTGSAVSRQLTTRAVRRITPLWFQAFARPQ